MIKKLGIYLSFWFASTFWVQAQNQLVYLRFDESTNNVSRIKSEIRQMNRECKGRFVLFYDNHFYEGDNLKQLLQQRRFLSNLEVYKPVTEREILSQWFSKELAESATNESPLVGTYDDKWLMSFILFVDDSREELIRLLDVNGLIKRPVELSFILFDSATELERFSFEEFSANIHPVFKF